MTVQVTLIYMYNYACMYMYIISTPPEMKCIVTMYILYSTNQPVVLTLMFVAFEGEMLVKNDFANSYRHTHTCTCIIMIIAHKSVVAM